MSPADASWSIRTLLSPVVARLLIYGVNPFDVERVVRNVERMHLRSARQLEARWLDEWGVLASAWHERSQAAAAQGRWQTARALGLQAAGCRLARFLVNGGDVARRREIYWEYAESYRIVADLLAPPATQVEVPIGHSAPLSAFLHAPADNSPHPCVVIFAGLGSCKEEMHTLARMMVERGIAALVPDLPGCGASLLRGELTCGAANLSAAFHGLADFVEQRAELDGARFGACGLCMGGGYAYRACAEDARYRWCVSLFPLFIDKVGESSTPQWMKGGDWFALQTGGKSAAQLLAEVGWRDTDSIACPYFLVHGRHDNWMPLERALLLYERATSRRRQLLVVEDEPAFSSGQAVTHTMPVGEQLGWVGPVVADWIAEVAGVAEGSKGGG